VIVGARRSWSGGLQSVALSVALQICGAIGGLQTGVVSGGLQSGVPSGARSQSVGLPKRASVSSAGASFGALPDGLLRPRIAKVGADP
jgi:hypothetical protein